MKKLLPIFLLAFGLFFLPGLSHASVLSQSGSFLPGGTMNCNGDGCDAETVCGRAFPCTLESLAIPEEEANPVATTTLYFYSYLYFSGWCNGFSLSQGTSSFPQTGIWTSPSTQFACSLDSPAYHDYGVLEFDDVTIASSGGQVYLDGGYTGDTSRVIEVGRTNATDTVSGDYYAWGCLATTLQDAFTCGENLQDVQMEGLNQYQADASTTISDGSSTTQSTVVFGATLEYENTSTPLQLQVEVEPSSTGFSDIPNVSSTFVTPGTFATVSSSVLSDGAYHWQARIADEEGEVTPWQTFNSSTDVDFVVSPAKEPVIIVPGIMGTTLDNASTGDEVWPNLAEMASSDINGEGDSYLSTLSLNSVGGQIVPIQSGQIIESQLLGFYPVYDNLINNFLADGYSSGTTLFTVPYDWRMDINSQVSALANQVAIAASSSPDGKVNIIAHSMGGLLVKDYLSTLSNTSTIDKVILAGVPQLGAPEAFNALMYGDNFSIPLLNATEIKTISQNMPSVYQLLPSSKYIDVNGPYVINSDNGSTQALDYAQTVAFVTSTDPTSNASMLASANSFHASLDDETYGVSNVYNIVGCDGPTMAGFHIYSGQDNPTDISEVVGDGTVPVTSAMNLADGYANYFALGVNHSGLVSDLGTVAIMREIIDNTTSTNLLPDDISTSLSDCISPSSSSPNGGSTLEISSHSPIALNVYDSHGDHTGPNASGSIDLDVPGSQYETVGQNTFVIVPASDTYSIEGQALSSGNFTLKIKEYDSSVNIASEATYVNIPLASASTTATLTGISSSTLDPDLSLDVYGDGTEVQSIPATALLNASSAADIYPPTITVATSSIPTSVTEGATTSITFSMSDGSSTIATSSALFNGVPFTSGQTLTFSTPGTSTIQFFAEDDNGNPAFKQYEVTVLATPPVISSFSPSSSSIVSGASTTLSWNATNASSVAITPGSFTTSTLMGSLLVTPTSTTTYTLTATNPNGTSTASTTITVSAPPASVSLIQTTSSYDGSFGGPLSETFASSVRAGDTLVALLQFYAPTSTANEVPSLTDSLGNHFTIVTSTKAEDTGTPRYPHDKVGEVIAYATGTPSGTDTVTVTFAGGGDYGGYMSLMEISPSMLDLTSHATGTSASPSAGTVTTTHSGEFAVANVIQDDNLGEQYDGTGEVLYPGVGWTISAFAGGGAGDVASEYRIASSTSSLTGTMSSTWYGNLTSTWMAGMATFEGE